MAEFSSNSANFSSLIRLRCLESHELPALPAGDSTTSAEQEQSRPKLEAFVTQALTDGHAFITTHMPNNFTSKKSNATSPPSAAKVDLVTEELKLADFPTTLRKGNQGDEVWFARTSVHENAAKAGTASWEEFDFGLRVDHSQHEMDYTPGVIGSNEVFSWRDQLRSEGNPEGKLAGWDDVDMVVREMKHSIPAPLDDRVFTVAVVTAKKEKECLVVQIPLFAKGLPNLKLNGTGVTAGRYVSIEHCELVDDGENVRWRMATASDAGGKLPMFLQKMGVPGAVIKDVGLFIDWSDKNRKK